MLGCNKMDKINADYKKHEAEIMEKAAHKEKVSKEKPYIDIVKFISDMIGFDEISKKEIESISKTTMELFEVKIK